MNTNVISLEKNYFAAALETGFVKTVVRDGFLIHTSVGIIKGETAYSCLVSPQPDDQVLLCRTGRAWYITAVLTRQVHTPLELCFPGETSLKVHKGALHIEATGKVDLQSLTEISLFAPECTQLSSRHLIASEEMTVNSGRVTAHLKETCYTGKRIAVLVDEITQRAKNVVRYVEGVETLNIGNLIKNIRQFLNIRSHHASITTRKDLKIDGERIHMG